MQSHLSRAFDLITPSADDSSAPRAYALLDGARDKRVHSGMLEAGNPWVLLYEGKVGPKLEAAAPRLVELRSEDALTEWLMENGWGDSWGIFARTSASLKDLRKHFRTFLMVKTEDGDKIYFRYYDPRVFRIYLPTCTPEELDYVFGPVEEYVMEGDDPLTLLRFGRTANGQLNLVEVDLRSKATSAPAAAPAPVVSGAPVDVSAAVAEIQGLRERLKTARSSGDAAAERAAAEEAFAALKTLHERAAVARPEDSAELKTLRQGLGRAVTRLSGRKAITAQAVASAVMSVLVSMGAHKG